MKTVTKKGIGTTIIILTLFISFGFIIAATFSELVSGRETFFKVLTALFVGTVAYALTPSFHGGNRLF